MLFSSVEFILLFLPITFFCYFGLTQNRQTELGLAWLVLASLFFYGWWNPSYLPLIVLSTAVNFSIGKRLSAAHGRPKLLLWSGILFNLGLLGYFKYAAFLVINANRIGVNWPVPEITLPLAISFFSFTQIAYLVDCHRGLVRNQSPLNYALFVTFFPHLIAGPVVHHRDIMPQFDSHWNWVRRYPNIVTGLFIFSLGLAKKSLLADSFARWATTGFDQAVTLSFFEAWFTSLSYTFQIYFDFSGYSDMAIGASLLFNIRLPINFNSPYKARDIQDFWRRWHMTLSRFLRDYLYIPLGGNRHGRIRTHINLLLTFTLGGLWHGASWMFVIWGLFHGGAVILHRVWQHGGFRLPGWLAWVLTFQFVNFTWIFFRAKTLEDALKILKGMLGMNGIMLPQRLNDYLGFLQDWGFQFGLWVAGVGGSSYTAPSLCLALLVVLALKNTNQLLLDNNSGRVIHPAWAVPVGLLALGSIIFSWTSPYTEFIYFNF